MPLKFIYLKSPPMGKEKWHKAKFEKSTKIASSLEKKHDKMEIKF